MSPAQRNAVSVGVKTTLIGALVVWIAALARDNVIYRPEYNAHVLSREATTRSIESEVQDVKYLICLDHPTDSKCREVLR